MKHFRYFSNDLLSQLSLQRLIEADYRFNDSQALDGLQEIDFFYYPTSTPAAQAGNQDYMEIRERVLKIAADAQGCGTFEPQGDRSSGALFKFDQNLYKEIMQIMPLGLYEASNQAVWSYLTVKCLPDVANWRYPNLKRLNSYERHFGTPRNAFRRIWLRSFVIGTEFELIDNVTEDQAVSIFERTALTSNPKVARGILRAMANSRLTTKSNSVYRDALKRIRRVYAVKALDAFEDSDLTHLFISVFKDAELAELESSFIT